MSKDFVIYLNDLTKKKNLEEKEEEESICICKCRIGLKPIESA